MSLYNLRNPAVKRLMKEAEELLHPTEEYHAQPLEDNLFEWHFTLRGPPNTDYEGGIYHGRITLPPDYPMKPPSIILLTVSSCAILKVSKGSEFEYAFCSIWAMDFKISGREDIIAQAKTKWHVDKKIPIEGNADIKYSYFAIGNKTVIPALFINPNPNGRFETNKKICLSISGHHPESWQPSWSIRTALLAIIGFMPTHGNGAIGSLDYSPEERQQLALKSQEWQCSECGSIKEIFFKKNYCYLKDDTPLEGPEVVPENDLNQSTNEPTLLPSVKEDNKLSETSISETVHSTCVGKRAKSPFHCHGSQVVKRRYQDIIATQDVVDNPGQISAKPRSNHFYIIVVWLIVFAIAFLCVRRLFSLS